MLGSVSFAEVLGPSVQVGCLQGNEVRLHLNLTCQGI